MTMRSRNPYTYRKGSGNSRDKVKGKGVVTLTIPIEMVGGITLGSFAFAAMTIWSAFMLISAAIESHVAPPPPSSTFFEESPINVTFTSSSYEEHWPGIKVPKWATKKINFRIPKEKQICFAHIGKTGGSTLGCSLGFMLHCDDGDDAAVKNENENQNHSSSSLLGKLSIHLFHTDVYNCDDDAGYFLFIIRDPIARALSAFNYNKPDENDFLRYAEWANRKAHFHSDCPFYHMEDFVQNGLREGGDSPDRCKKVAIETLQGIDRDKRKSPDHWYFNYQYYYEAIPSDSKILTIRNEHMVEDIRSIENLFECHEEDRLALATQANTYRSDQDDLYLSDESISILCQALCNEIQIYKKILRQALNLSQDQLRVSLMDLEAKCPHEAMDEECSDVLPDISEKLENHRGY